MGLLDLGSNCFYPRTITPPTELHPTHHTPSFIFFKWNLVLLCRRFSNFEAQVILPVSQAAGTTDVSRCSWLKLSMLIQFSNRYGPTKYVQLLHNMEHESEKKGFSCVLCCPGLVRPKVLPDPTKFLSNGMTPAPGLTLG